MTPTNKKKLRATSKSSSVCQQERDQPQSCQVSACSKNFINDDQSMINAAHPSLHSLEVKIKSLALHIGYKITLQKKVH